MQIKKFYAASLPAAIRDVRRTLGPEAVILSTRHLSTEDAGVFVNGGRARVEVTAARETPEPTAPRPSARPTRPAVQPEMRDVLARRVEENSTRRALEQRDRTDGGSQQTATGADAGKEKIETRLPAIEKTASEAAASGDVETLQKIVAEIRALRKRLDTIDTRGQETIRANPSARPNPYFQQPPQTIFASAKEKPAPEILNAAEPQTPATCPDEGTAPSPGARGLLGASWTPIPPNRQIPACDMQRKLREQGVDEALIQRILERMHFVAGRTGGHTVERGTYGQFVHVVRDFLPDAEGLGAGVVFSSRAGASDGPRRIALVGPTGVGKTTTIAKIASHCALREGMKVGLVTLDTYRIAAAEQLKTYARLLGVPVAVVSEPARLARTFEQLAAMDLILVDTPGHSPRDDEAMDRLAATLAADRQLEVQLLVPASVRIGEMREIMAAFQSMRYGRLVFSKLDEATSWGELLSAWIMGGFDVSYFTTGQRVPEDLQTASVDTLCQCLMAPRPTRRA